MAVASQEVVGQRERTSAVYLGAEDLTDFTGIANIYNVPSATFRRIPSCLEPSAMSRNSEELRVQIAAHETHYVKGARRSTESRPQSGPHTKCPDPDRLAR